MKKILILGFALMSGCASSQVSQTKNGEGGLRNVASSAEDLPSKAVCYSEGDRAEIDFHANTILSIHNGQSTVYDNKNSWMLREDGGGIHINHSGPHAMPYLLVDIEPTEKGFSGDVGAKIYPGPVQGRCTLQP